MVELEQTLLLKPAEVAETLRISVSKVYQMLAANELPAIRIGAAVRVPRSSLEAWVLEQQIKQGTDQVGLKVLGGSG